MVGKMKIKLTKKKEVFNYCNPYIIAEIGANHNGDMDLAKKMIDSAIKCGCDAVKFQSWNDKSLISKTGYKQNTVFNDNKKKTGVLGTSSIKAQSCRTQRLIATGRSERAGA